MRLHSSIRSFWRGVPVSVWGSVKAWLRCEHAGHEEVHEAMRLFWRVVPVSVCEEV